MKGQGYGEQGICLPSNLVGNERRRGQRQRKRQRAAIQAFAKRAGYEIVQEFNDEAVKGADAIDARQGFAAMMEAIAANGCRTIIVETASRFARDLIVQEVGHAMLKERGIDLIAADSPDPSSTTRLRLS